MKKIILSLILFGVAGAGYVYYTSQQQPANVPIANVAPQEAPAEEIVIASEDVSGQYVLSSGSYLEWKATKPSGFHTGKVFFIEGGIEVLSGIITQGNFVLDMTSITLDDIESDKLLNEIKEDIFSASEYPTSSFVITSVSRSGANDYTVQGDLTITDQTHPIAFPATIRTIDGIAMFSTSFAIDRMVRGLNAFEGIANNYIEYTVNIVFEPIE